MKTYNADGLVDHRGSRKIVEHVEAREEAPKKTLAETLEEAIARDDVRAAVAVSFGLPANASIGEVVKTAIDRDFLLNTIDHAQKLAASPPASYEPINNTTRSKEEKS